MDSNEKDILFWRNSIQIDSHFITEFVIEYE